MKWLPNLLTALNLVSGLTALTWTFQGRTETACWFILLATLFDGLDGRLARWLGLESNFGKIFDSCGDFISFGCAPAFLFYTVYSHASWILSLVIACLFTSSSFFRLIRFHRRYEVNKANAVDYFEGLPTTASGGLFASLILFLNPPQNFFLFCLVSILLLSGLMVSQIPYPNFKYIHLGIIPVGIGVIGGILSVFSPQNQAPVIPLAIFSGYTCFGGMERWLRRKLRSA